jgi:hypothetical protein
VRTNNAVVACLETNRMLVHLNQHAPESGQLAFFHEDIPGNTWQVNGTGPLFYLPAELKRGDHCRQVRELAAHRKLEQAQLAASAAAQHHHAPSASSVAASTLSVASTTGSGSASADAPESVGAPLPSPSPELPTFVDFTLEKLCDVDLQRAMEESRVLNSWDEGSYLSVIRTGQSKMAESRVACTYRAYALKQMLVMLPFASSLPCALSLSSSLSPPQTATATASVTR